MSLFQHLELDSSEMSSYALQDNTVPYTRSRVATDDENYDLLLLRWNEGKESLVHNHPGDGCYVKVISGSIKETMYDNSGGSPQLKSEAIANAGHVCYIDDTLGLHKLGNPSEQLSAITLHLYTPPMKSCKVWTESVNKKGKSQTLVKTVALHPHNILPRYVTHPSFKNNAV